MLQTYDRTVCMTEQHRGSQLCRPSKPVPRGRGRRSSRALGPLTATSLGATQASLDPSSAAKRRSRGWSGESTFPRRHADTIYMLLIAKIFAMSLCVIMPTCMRDCVTGESTDSRRHALADLSVSPHQPEQLAGTGGAMVVRHISQAEGLFLTLSRRWLRLLWRCLACPAQRTEGRLGPAMGGRRGG